MALPTLPWLIGGGAALAALIYATQKTTTNQIVAPPPQVDPAWAKKYSVDPRILYADLARTKYGVELLKPGQQMVRPTNLQVTADVGPIRTGTIKAKPQQIRDQIQHQNTFTARWGIKEVWAASELIELLDKNPAVAKFLFRFPVANDRQAQEMDAMMSGRVTIIIDTVEALQYFSGVLLLAMMGSFDVAKGTINLDKPVIKNLMRLFSYHNWQVSEGLTEYQLETLNRFVGSPIDRWLRAPDGSRDESEVKYYHASGPYWSPAERNWHAGVWYRCVPNEYPGMNIPNSPTANADYYMKPLRADNPDDNFRWIDTGGGGYWTKNVSSVIQEGYFKDHLGDARPFAKKILGNGRLWLFEYAALRLQNITYASSMIKGVSDLAGQALGALLNAVQGLVMLAAGAPGGEKLLMDAIGTALKTLIAFILDAIKAEEDNEKVQRSVESHLNTLLATFWSTSLQTLHTSSYLSGYQLGVIPNFQEGMLHAGYRTGASRSVSYLMRNFIQVHDQAMGGVCAYMHLPQIPLFVRGVPFAVITSATREHLYAVESVYGYILSPTMRAAYAEKKSGSITLSPEDLFTERGIAAQNDLRIDPDMKGPVGVRIISIHRGSGVVKVEHGPGAGGPAIPFHQYVPGFGLPGKIVSQSGGSGEAIL